MVLGAEVSRLVIALILLHSSRNDIEAASSPINLTRSVWTHTPSDGAVNENDIWSERDSLLTRNRPDRLSTATSPSVNRQRYGSNMTLDDTHLSSEKIYTNPILNVFAFVSREVLYNTMYYYWLSFYEKLSLGNKFLTFILTYYTRFFVNNIVLITCCSQIQRPISICT